MCNFNRPIVDMKLLPRISQHLHSRLAPRGFKARRAPSVHPSFLTRSALPLSVLVCILLFGTTPAAASAVGFGHVQLGATSGVTQSLSFTISSGTTLGSVAALTLGVPGLDFTVVTNGTTCTPGTTNTTCNVNIQFLPTTPGLRRGAVVLYDNSNPANTLMTVPLYGFADAPIAALAPNTAAVISTGGAVSLTAPDQIALDGSGNLYVANFGASSVVKIPPGGGSASVVATGAETLLNVGGVALDGAGNLFIADYGDNRIVVVTPGGVGSVLNISGLSPGLSSPSELAFDGQGNLYIADAPNGRIVEVSSLVVAGSTFSGTGSVLGTGSFTLASNSFMGVAVDPAETVYIADGPNNRIIEVASGVASLLTPAGITPNLSAPLGVGVDAMGNVYIADSGNNRIVEVTTAGVASVASTPGLPRPSTLSNPNGVTVDSSGNVFIPDTANNRVVEAPVSGTSLAFTSTKVGLTSSNSPQTATVTNLGDQPLVFSANPAYPADFSINSGASIPCTSSMSLLAGTVCNVSVNFTPQTVGILNENVTVTDNSRNLANSTQQVAVSGTGLTPGDTTATTESVIPSPLTNGQTATITATVVDTTAGDTSDVPTGSVTFMDSVGTTLTTLNGGVGVHLNASGQATLSGVLLSGIGTHTITAIYGGASETYLSSTGTTTVSLGKAPVTVTGPVVQPVQVTLGQAGSVPFTVTGPYSTIPPPSGTLSYTIFNASSTSVATGTVPLTAGSTNSTAAVPVANTLAPGSYTVSVTYGGDSNYLAVATAITISLTINKTNPTVLLVSSLNPVLLESPVTFTATVSSTVATPTGSINFTDGQTLLSSVPLTHGVATYTTSSLALGVHSISAIYSGDANFTGVTGATVSQTVEDFTLTVSTPVGQSTSPLVLPGGSVGYTIQVAPTQGAAFPSAVTLTFSGLPAGATATLTPASLAAGSASASVSLVIQLAQQLLARHPFNPLGRDVALAMMGGIFLLPFGRRLRRSAGKAGRLACLLLLGLAAICATLGLTGCGGTNSGYFGQQVQTFTVTVTATSGALTHSTTVSFQVE